MARQITITNAPIQRWHTFVQGLLFVAGFATFVIGLFGFVGTLLGDVFYDMREAVRIVGGAVLIVFGLFKLRLVNLPFLYSDTRTDLSSISEGLGSARSYVAGMAFAAGWTPCIGPFLGAILTLSVTNELGARIALLFAYVLGLGLPFLLVAGLADRVMPLFKQLQKHTRLVEVIGGLLLIGVGVALLLGFVSRLSASLASVPFELEYTLLGDAALSIPVAGVAGLLSFLSPCVLPLLSAYIGFISGVAITQAVRQ
jgi:cytochrome c-type biogenesis protein